MKFYGGLPGHGYTYFNTWNGRKVGGNFVRICIIVSGIVVKAGPKGL